MQRQLIVAKDGSRMYVDADTVELVEMNCDLEGCDRKFAVNKGNMTEAEILQLSFWITVARLVGLNGQLIPATSNYCGFTHAIEAMTAEQKAVVTAAIDAPVNGVVEKVDLAKLREIAGLAN